jgi:hypothetical protein
VTDLSDRIDAQVSTAASAHSFWQHLVPELSADDRLHLIRLIGCRQRGPASIEHALFFARLYQRYGDIGFRVCGDQCHWEFKR